MVERCSLIDWSLAYYNYTGLEGRREALVECFVREKVFFTQPANELEGMGPAHTLKPKVSDLVCGTPCALDRRRVDAT